MRMSPLFEEFYSAVPANKEIFEKQRVFIGRPRLAVRTEDYRYDHLEFFESHNPAIYTPASTIDELR